MVPSPEGSEAGSGSEVIAPDKRKAPQSPTNESVDRAAKRQKNRPETGLESLPEPVDATKLPFKIVRLIRNTTKTGIEANSSIDMDALWFSVNYGDFLLDLTPPDKRQIAHVRNYQGEERFVPRRMLQPTYIPWGIPEGVPQVAGNGSPSPLRIVQMNIFPEHSGGVPFFRGEYVMVLETGELVDFERRRGNEVSVESGRRAVQKLTLDEVVDEPWGILVDESKLKWGFETTEGAVEGDSEADSEGDAELSEQGDEEDTEEAESYTEPPAAAPSKRPQSEKDDKNDEKKSKKDDKKVPVVAEKIVKGSKTGRDLVIGDKIVCQCPRGDGMPCKITYTFWGN